MNKLYETRSSYKITSLIYSEIIKEQREKLAEASDPSIIYVTDLVSCTHKRYLRILFPELTIRFDPPAVLGDLVHIGLEEYLKKHGYDVEVPIEKEYEIHGKKYMLKGRLDAYNRDEGIIVEIKSGRSAQNLPREHHVLQLKIYMELMDAKQGILIYVTPEKILEYLIRRDKKINIKSLLETVIEDQVHPKWSWECKYCIFQKLCPYYTRQAEE